MRVPSLFTLPQRWTDIFRAGPPASPASISATSGWTPSPTTFLCPMARGLLPGPDAHNSPPEVRRKAGQPRGLAVTQFLPVAARPTTPQRARTLHKSLVTRPRPYLSARNPARRGRPARPGPDWAPLHQAPRQAVSPTRRLVPAASTATPPTTGSDPYQAPATSSMIPAPGGTALARFLTRRLAFTPLPDSPGQDWRRSLG
jgi:hypothetical protein